jgi:uncharacterized membrane protein (UPF0127 family)
MKMKKFLFRWILAFFLLLLSVAATFPQEREKVIVRLTIKGKTLKVQVAQTEPEKAQGLMFRDSLGQEQGMLFVYEKEEFLSFWMKNTRLPLSIAFIDRNHRIVDIQDMEPFRLTTHSSAIPAKFALEVNRGWFQKNGIHVGDSVSFALPGRK